MTSENRLVLFSGPCVIESSEVCLRVADVLTDLQTAHPEIEVVFKASFDKANRTSYDSFRGLGMDEGLKVLQQVKDKTGLPVITDIHERQQASAVGEVVDYVQVPAFLCRQTDVLLAAAGTGKPVLVKKGQFIDPRTSRFIADNLHSGGCEDILIGERGTAFGHGDLVVDFRSLVVMRQPEVRVVYDGTHSVQQPGASNGRTGGRREFIIPLARAAVAVGVDGLFFESHPDPDNALSDGSIAVPLEHLQPMIEMLLRIREAATESVALTF